MSAQEVFEALHGAKTDADLVAAARRAAITAARHAHDVDRLGVFPSEAFGCLAEEGLLAVMVPRALGGGSAAPSIVAEICYILGSACASTGLIFAMHQASLACIVRHGVASAWHRDFLRRVAAEQLLLASSTTEGGNGGNVRASEAALRPDGETVRLTRAATVISYGSQADAVVSTARRTAEAPASDQVLIVLRKEDMTLAPTGGWDTLGMRGTCSAGFALEAAFSPDQVLPVGYGKIHPLTMVPMSHLFWGAVWAGIAAAAVGKAQMFVRTASRRAGGTMPPGAVLATRANASLRTLTASLSSAIERVERMSDDEQALASIEMQTFLNLFKVEASELAASAVTTAMRACGLSGYRNDGDFSMGRHLRDVLSASVMIHNERILANIGGTALLSGVPTTLRGEHL